ncbi:MAG: alpha/beta hydrolase [Actinomycetota bacterium]|nr:alpha/beta hydrolase [Actinomycetota bacterium]
MDADGRSWWPHNRAVSQLYGRLDRTSAARMATRLRPQPQAVFGAPYPLERPPDVPSTFLYAREDELFDDECSRWIARSLLGLEAIELPGGHFPMLEHPAILADILHQDQQRVCCLHGRAARRRVCVSPSGTTRVAAAQDCPVLDLVDELTDQDYRAARRSQKRSSVGHPPGSTRWRWPLTLSGIGC